MSRWTLTIDDWLPPSLNRLLGHWGRAARLKREARDTIAVAAYQCDVPHADGPRRVSLTLTIAGRARPLDPDNAWKAVLDGLTHARLLVDDRAASCELGDIVIEKGKRKQTVIVLEDL